MTRKQHAAKWRTIAELEDGPEQHGLCFRVSAQADSTDQLTEMRKALALMRPDGIPLGYWWVLRDITFGPLFSQYDRNSDNRVLAALFLAAMVEAGDA